MPSRVGADREVSSRTERRDPDAPAAALAGRVAVVAGATRGAGRGIARALAEAGAIVYCTGRSVHGAPSAYGRPETLEQTVELIERAGGKAVARRVDHTDERAVEALFAAVVAEHGRVDVVVNSVAGEDPLLRQWGSFWDVELGQADAALRQAFTSHVITAKHAARHMIRAKRGLIVEVTESDTLSAGGNPLAQLAKAGLKLAALNMAAELAPHGVAAVSITPGFLRSEAMLERLGVDESSWREAGQRDPNFLVSETPLFVGRAVAALAADPNILAKTGRLFSSWEASREYGFTDEDGSRPDWGAHDIDFSVLPPSLVELLRKGCALQLEWLETVAARTRRLLSQMPEAAAGDVARPAPNPGAPRAEPSDP